MCCLYRETISNQQLLVDAYTKTFQLSSSEVASLRSNNVTLEFFTALRKTQLISNNCKVLMQAGHQTSALSLMEQISSYQVKEIYNYIIKFIILYVLTFINSLIYSKWQWKYYTDGPNYIVKTLSLQLLVHYLFFLWKYYKIGQYYSSKFSLTTCFLFNI